MYTISHARTNIMASTTFTLRVETEMKKRLEKLAKSTGRSRSFLAAEALREYLDVNEWQVAGMIWASLTSSSKRRLAIGSRLASITSAVSATEPPDLVSLNRAPASSPQARCADVIGAVPGPIE